MAPGAFSNGTEPPSKEGAAYHTEVAVDRLTSVPAGSLVDHAGVGRFGKGAAITPDPAFEELRHAGLAPWPTHRYDAQSPFRHLFTFHNTAFKLVLFRLDFWFIFLLHIFLCIMYYDVSGNPVLVSSSNGAQQTWPFVSATSIAIPGSMLVFFLVFHTNQAYNRFWVLYNKTASADGRIGTRLCPELRVVFQDGAFPQARETRLQVARHVVAMYYLSYSHLPFYKASAVFDWCWNKCESHGLLTHSEVARLKTIPSGKPHKELAVWIGRRLMVHVKRGDIHIENYNEIFDHVNDIIGNVGTLYDYEAMPVPFAFFHILNFILFIYLVLVAYTYTMFSYYYSIIGVFLTALSLLSLRELASVLSDPLGHDDVDLPVFDYAMAVHNNVHKSIFLEPEGEDNSFNEGY